MIPESHPLQELFQDLVGRHYAGEIGIRDPQIVAYVSHLLAEFCEADQLYKVHDAVDRPLADVGEMLLESDPVYGPAPSFDRERHLVGDELVLVHVVDRLAALVDGLALQVALEDSEVDAARMLQLCLGYAASVLGFSLPRRRAVRSPRAPRETRKVAVA